MTNRRQHARATVCTTVHVRVRHNDAVELALYSVSVGGACMVGAITLAVGEPVQLRFAIDGTDVDVDGEVVRAEAIDMTADRVAVRFVELSADARARLHALVERSLAARF